MTNKELWEKYTNFTLDLSINARNLAYVAAGLSWAFKTETGTFPAPVIVALRSLIVFFLADMLQYIAGAVIMRFWLRGQEKKKHKETGSIEGDYHQPGWIDSAPMFFWLVKIVALLVAYLFLGIYIFQWDIFGISKS